MRRAPAVLITVAILAGCGGGKDTATITPAATGASPVAGCAAGTAKPTAAQSYAAEPPLSIARTTYSATIATTCGTLTVALDGGKAPHTVNSFAFLAAKRYFDGSTCHRLTTSGIYVLQCGDPTGAGSGGPGYTIPDENLKGAAYPAGTIAMANTGQPHTGGSQFFLVYRDTALPPQYTPFGRVTAGLDVLRRIAAAGTDNANGDGDGHPKARVVITAFTVSKG